MKRVGILITGSGFYDGTSPWDVSFILKTIEAKGTFPVPFAPNTLQGGVINHQNEDILKEKRNSLIEASRLVRGELFKLEEIEHTNIDALVIPGGRGSLLTLTDFRREGIDCNLYPPLKQLIRSLYVRGKPIAGIGYGIFVVVLALNKVTKLIITPGDDPMFNDKLISMGASLMNVPPDEVVFDDDNNIFSTPGITPSGSVLKGSVGISIMVENIIEAKKIRRRLDEGNTIEKSE